MNNNFFVYILKCSDNSLYCGYTVDLKKRLQNHNNKIGAKYTRGRTPVELVYFEKLPDKSSALTREAKIKKLNRQKKLQLIESFQKNYLNDNSIFDLIRL